MATSTRRSLYLLASGLIAGTLFMGGASPAHGGEEGPSPREILQSIADFYSGKDHLAYNMELEFVQQMDTDVIRTKSSGVFQFSRPNIFHGRVTGEGANTIVISDGEQLLAAGPRSRGLYALEKAPGNLDDIFMGESLPIGLLFSNIDLLWNNLLTANPADALTRESTDVTLGEGTSTKYELIIESERMSLTMLVPREGDPMITEAIIDMTESARAQLANRIGEQAAARANISTMGKYKLEWVFGAEAAPDASDLAIPPDPEMTQARSTLGGLGIMSERAPAFRLIGEKARNVSLASLTSGREVSLPHGEEAAPGVSVLQFWASWCAPCIRSMPDINDLAGEFEEQGVRFFAVNFGEPKTAVEKYKEDNGYESLDFLVDERRLASEAFGVMGVPQITIVDSEGVIRHVYTGFSPLLKEIIRKDISNLVAEKSGE